MAIVKVKGVANPLEFPDDMPFDEVKEFLLKRFGDLKRVAEPLATVATSALAEPISGIAGIGSALFGGTAQGARTVKDVQEFLTFRSRSEEGKEGLQALGDFLQPIGDVISAAETNLGNKVLEATGSPALAAIAHTLPTAVLEALGISQVRALTRPVAKADLFTPRSFAGKVKDLKETKNIIKGNVIPRNNNIFEMLEKIPKDDDFTDLVDSKFSQGDDVVGVRVITKNPVTHKRDNFNVGDILPHSFEQIDDLRIFELDGTSAININYDGFDVEGLKERILDLEGFYEPGDQVLLVSGKNKGPGNDLNEALIDDAEVIHSFN